MKTLSLLLLLTTGCGPAFTERVFFEDPPDAAPDAPPKVEEAATTAQLDAQPDAQPDVVLTADAGSLPLDVASIQPDVGSPTLLDASSIDASPIDASSTCTPFLMQGAACNVIYDIPRYVGGWYNNKCVGIVRDTPPQCQCKETYNCECFKAAGICKSNFSCNSLYGTPQLATCNDNLPPGTP